MSKKKLKIYTVSSNLIRVPPRPSDLVPGNSGATQFVTEVIIEGLVKRGHDITLFASGDSKTHAKLIKTSPRATVKMPEVQFGTPLSSHGFFEYYGIGLAYKMAQKNKNIDLIHSHFTHQTSVFSDLLNIPTVSTLHSPLNNISIASKTALSEFKNQSFISISNTQRKPLPKLNYLATIPHGIDFKKVKWTKKVKPKTAVIAGRLVRNKGVHEAILAAKKAGFTLYLAGDGTNNEYWDTKVKPYIDNRTVIHVNFLARPQLLKLFSECAVMLLPILWEEPFGLVMIEALATGTPVIAFNRGSVNEIIVNNKTGFIVDNVYQMAEKMKQISLINREDCRKHIEQNFGLDKMIDAYEQTFLSISK